jgi:hypothetical protein
MTSPTTSSAPGDASRHRSTQQDSICNCIQYCIIRARLLKCCLSLYRKGHWSFSALITSSKAIASARKCAILQLRHSPPAFSPHLCIITTARYICAQRRRGHTQPNSLSPSIKKSVPLRRSITGPEAIHPPPFHVQHHFGLQDDTLINSSAGSRRVNRPTCISECGCVTYGVFSMLVGLCRALKSDAGLMIFTEGSSSLEMQRRTISSCDNPCIRMTRSPTCTLEEHFNGTLFADAVVSCIK